MHVFRKTLLQGLLLLSLLLGLCVIREAKSEVIPTPAQYVRKCESTCDGRTHVCLWGACVTKAEAYKGCDVTEDRSDGETIEASIRTHMNTKISHARRRREYSFRTRYAPADNTKPLHILYPPFMAVKKRTSGEKDREKSRCVVLLTSTQGNGGVAVTYLAQAASLRSDPSYNSLKKMFQVDFATRSTTGVPLKPESPVTNTNADKCPLVDGFQSLCFHRFTDKTDDALRLSASVADDGSTDGPTLILSPPATVTDLPKEQNPQKKWTLFTKAVVWRVLDAAPANYFASSVQTITHLESNRARATVPVPLLSLAIFQWFEEDAANRVSKSDTVFYDVSWASSSTTEVDEMIESIKARNVQSLTANTADSLSQLPTFGTFGFVKDTLLANKSPSIAARILYKLIATLLENSFPRAGQRVFNPEELERDDDDEEVDVEKLRNAIHGLGGPHRALVYSVLDFYLQPRTGDTGDVALSRRGAVTDLLCGDRSDACNALFVKLADMTTREKGISWMRGPGNILPFTGDANNEQKDANCGACIAAVKKIVGDIPQNGEVWMDTLVHEGETSPDVKKHFCDATRGDLYEMPGMDAVKETLCTPMLTIGHLRDHLMGLGGDLDIRARECCADPACISGSWFHGFATSAGGVAFCRAAGVSQWKALPKTDMTATSRNVVVAGGGPVGLMTAIQSALAGATKVTLIEMREMTKDPEKYRTLNYFFRKNMLRVNVRELHTIGGLFDNGDGTTAWPLNAALEIMAPASLGGMEPADAKTPSKRDASRDGSKGERTNYIDDVESDYAEKLCAAPRVTAKALIESELRRNQASDFGHVYAHVGTDHLEATLRKVADHVGVEVKKMYAVDIWPKGEGESRRWVLRGVPLEMTAQGETKRRAVHGKMNARKSLTTRSALEDAVADSQFDGNVLEEVEFDVLASAGGKHDQMKWWQTFESGDSANANCEAADYSSYKWIRGCKSTGWTPFVWNELSAPQVGITGNFKPVYDHAKWMDMYEALVYDEQEGGILQSKGQSYPSHFLAGVTCYKDSAKTSPGFHDACSFLVNEMTRHAAKNVNRVHVDVRVFSAPHYIYIGLGVDAKGVKLFGYDMEALADADKCKGDCKTRMENLVYHFAKACGISGGLLDERKKPWPFHFGLGNLVSPTKALPVLSTSRNGEIPQILSFQGDAKATPNFLTGSGVNVGMEDARMFGHALRVFWEGSDRAVAGFAPGNIPRNLIWTKWIDYHARFNSRFLRSAGQRYHGQDPSEASEYCPMCATLMKELKNWWTQSNAPGDATGKKVHSYLTKAVECAPRAEDCEGFFPAYFHDYVADTLNNWREGFRDNSIDAKATCGGPSHHGPTDLTECLGIKNTATLNDISKFAAKVTRKQSVWLPFMLGESGFCDYYSEQTGNRVETAMCSRFTDAMKSFVVLFADTVKPNTQKACPTSWAIDGTCNSHVGKFLTDLVTANKLREDKKTNLYAISNALEDDAAVETFCGLSLDMLKYGKESGLAPRTLYTLEFSAFETQRGSATCHGAAAGDGEMRFKTLPKASQEQGVLLP